MLTFARLLIGEAGGQHADLPRDPGGGPLHNDRSAQPMRRADLERRRPSVKLTR